MTYWDYKFLDWLLQRVLEFPMPWKLNRRIVKVWSKVQTAKLRLWFDLPKTRRGFISPLWQDGAGQPKKSMAQLKAEAKDKKSRR